MASNFSPMYFEQPIVIFDTTQSLNSTSGSFVLYGGVSINATYQSESTSSGAFVLSGGMAVQKNLNVGGITNISATAQSEGTGSGALVVEGGVGIAKNLHVGQDTFISGNLYVNGLTTSVNSTTINVSDNTFTLNSGPSGSRDAGILIQRYQTAVDDGSGDVVGNNEPFVLESTFTLGGSNSVTFATTDNALAVDGWWVKVTSGTPYVRKITSATNIAGTVTLTLETPFTSSVTTSDTFKLYNRNYVAQYYEEANDEYILGYIANAQDIQTQLQGTGLLNVRAKGLFATNSTIENLSVASLTAGNIGLDQATILNTFVVTGTTTLGSLFVSGASQIGGDLTVTGASLLNLGVSAGSLNVTGESTLHGAVTAGALNVTGASLLQLGLTGGSLNITGESWLQGAVTAGALSVTGASILRLGVSAGSLDVTGASVLHNGLTTGSLTVTGASIFDNGITTGSLNVTGESTLHDNVTMGSNVVIDGPAFQIPYGDVASRPAGPQQGYIRYNTEYTQFEGFGPGSAWGSLGGVVDIAQTTKIIASETPSVTDGNLYFFTVGVEQMRINSAGNIGIHTTSPGYTLDVVGTLGATIGLTAGSLNVTGESKLHGAVTAGALFVTGASLLVGNVTVSGASTFNSGITAGSINVTGASILQDDFTVTTGSVIVSTNDYTPIIGSTSATGGSILFNTVDVSPSMGDISRERSFIAANNVSAPTDITGFAFNNAVVRAFDAVVSVTILGEVSNKYAYYNLKGIQKGSNWVINSSYVGDASGFTFSITNSGQIRYTSTDVAGYLSSYVNFRAMTTTIN